MLESRGSRVPSQIYSGLCRRYGHRLAESPLATLEGATRGSAGSTCARFVPGHLAGCEQRSRTGIEVSAEEPQEASVGCAGQDPAQALSRQLRTSSSQPQSARHVQFRKGARQPHDHRHDRRTHWRLGCRLRDRQQVPPHRPGTPHRRRRRGGLPPVWGGDAPAQHGSPDDLPTDPPVLGVAVSLP